MKFAAAAFLATMASALPCDNCQGSSFGSGSGSGSGSYSTIVTTAHTFATTHQYDAQFQSDSSGNDYYPGWRPETKPSGCASWDMIGAYARAFGNSCCNQGLLDYCGAQQNNFDLFVQRPVVWRKPDFYQNCYNVWQNPSELSGATRSSSSVSVSVGGGTTGQGFNGGSQGFNGGSKEYIGGSQGSNGGSQEYNGGSQGFNGGSQEYNGGSKDYTGGSKEYNGGLKEYAGGSKEYAGGSKEYDGGSQDYNGGLKDYNGGSQECKTDVYGEKSCVG